MPLTGPEKDLVRKLTRNKTLDEAMTSADAKGIRDPDFQRLRATYLQHRSALRIFLRLDAPEPGATK